MSAFTAGLWMWIGKEMAELLSCILTIAFIFMAFALITGLIAIADWRHERRRQARRRDVK